MPHLPSKLSILDNLEGKLRQRKIFFLGYFWSKQKWGVCQNSKIDVCPGQHIGHPGRYTTGCSATRAESS